MVRYSTATRKNTYCKLRAALPYSNQACLYFSLMPHILAEIIASITLNLSGLAVEYCLLLSFVLHLVLVLYFHDTDLLVQVTNGLHNLLEGVCSANGLQIDLSVLRS
jgi:hypothetical protein